MFRCLCFATTLSQGRKKFNSRVRRCVFLSYPFGVKGYKLVDLKTNEILLSKDVTFHEQFFPFKAPLSETPSNTITLAVQPQQYNSHYFFILDPLNDIYIFFLSNT